MDSCSHDDDGNSGAGSPGGVHGGHGGVCGGPDGGGRPGGRPGCGGAEEGPVCPICDPWAPAWGSGVSLLLVAVGERSMVGSLGELTASGRSIVPAR
eukprot:4913778-Prymnesium_polylepis.2